jgi:hypothetical protein
MNIYISMTTPPSSASNPELTTSRSAPFVDALPAAVPVLEEALVPVPVPLVTDAWGGVTGSTKLQDGRS